MRRFPLYKGATRAAVMWGVPIIPLIVMVMGVALVAMLVSLWWWGLLVPSWLLMRQVTKTDDRAFRILALWARTKLANRARLVLRAGRGEVWGGSSYALADARRRSWGAEDLRWRG